MICRLNDQDVSCSALMAEMNTSFPFGLEKAIDVFESAASNARNFDRTTELFLIVIYVTMIIAGVVANLSVSYVVARRTQMHTPRNLYIVNLTISDMTLCIICMPFTLVLLLRRAWTMGPLLCKLVPFLQGTNIMVSIGTITVIAGDRYCTIVRGCDASNNKKRVIKWICLVWLFSALAAMPIAVFMKVEPFMVNDHLVIYEVCLEKWPSSTQRISYTITILLLQAVFPALVLAAVHARIAAYLNQHARTQTDSRRARRELTRNRRTTLYLSGVAALFAISWLPLHIHTLIIDIMYSSEVSEPDLSSQDIYWLLALCHITAMSSAISNPVVYGWLNSNIRNEFLQLLPGKCAAAPSRTIRHTEEHTTKTNLQTNNTATISNQLGRRDSGDRLLIINPAKPTTNSTPESVLITAL